MSLEKVLFLDDNIEVIVGNIMYVFKVRNIFKDKLIVSSTIKCTLEKLGVKEKDTVYIKAYKTNGIYEFAVIITSASQEKSVCFLELELSSEIKKYQRREFFRLDVDIPLHLKVIHDNETKKISEYEAVTVDISGGGMKVKTMDSLPSQVAVESTIYFRKYYEKFKDINIMGRILRCQKGMNDDNEHIVYIQFDKKERKESEKIIRYIFEIQREELRRVKSK
jgi:c-di-GMP-binding flagellar brake protein YcgR